MGKRPFYRKVRRTLYETVSDSGNSVLRYRGHDDKEYYVASSNDPNVGPGGGMIEVTWQELKNKRDAGELTPGCLYRITDYQCTTTQENTKSAGHQFDIVLLALSEDKLAEEGWAMMHDNVYDVTFSDGITKQCYIYFEGTDYYIIDIITMLGYGGVITDNDLEVNEQLKTAISDNSSSILRDENYTYNYFQNSNLSAWKVWYCLDNDKNRFAWADDSVDESVAESITYYGRTATFIYERNPSIDAVGDYGWSCNENGAPTQNLYTATLTIIPGTTKAADSPGRKPSYNIGGYTPAHEGTGLSNGRGVIYRLIDEFNNDIKYDFKNIQFKRPITDGQYDARGDETWCYTLNVWYQNMCQDASIVGNTLPNDEGFVTGVYDNKFGYTTAFNIYLEGVNTFAFVLGDNVVLSFDDDGYYGIYSNTIGNIFHNNTIGNNFYFNTIGNAFNSNTIGNNFGSNTIGNYFRSNVIGNGADSNVIGNGFISNTTGDDISLNTIGNKITRNTIGNNFHYNTIGNFFISKTVSDNTSYKNYGNNGVELATK